jgi:hypothetical protein
MSRITLAPNASGTGTLTVAAPNTNTDRTITLPDVTTTLVGTDATQTLTNKTIASSQLTGALPAIDGSALTGIVTGGMTLLGTIATTSGSSVTLSGLTLTSYKQLQFVVNGVSQNSAAASALRLNGYSLVTLYAYSVADIGSGGGNIDLSNGLFWFSGMTLLGATPQTNAQTAAGASGLTTASTSVTFTASAGTFDAGSILIYGVK